MTDREEFTKALEDCVSLTYEDGRQLSGATQLNAKAARIKVQALYDALAAERDELSADRDHLRGTYAGICVALVKAGIKSFGYATDAVHALAAERDEAHSRIAELKAALDHETQQRVEAETVWANAAAVVAAERDQWRRNCEAKSLHHLDAVAERDRLAAELADRKKFRGTGDPQFDEPLQTADPEFTAWVATLPDTYWARYDLSAARVGWHFGRAPLTAELAEARKDAGRLEFMVREACRGDRIAKDADDLRAAIDAAIAQETPR